MTIADTDVLIDYLNGREPVAGRVAHYLARQELQTTVLTQSELLAGADRQSQVDAIGACLAGLVILPLDQAISEAAAAVARQLKAIGRTISLTDCLLAAAAIAHGADLLTHHVRHFEFIDGLRLAPTSAAAAYNEGLRPTRPHAVQSITRIG